jgi:RNA polymerase sigma-70 factor, ECF subfamily
VTGERAQVSDDLDEPLHPDDERALVERAVAGDHLAISRLYDLTFERIYRYVLVKVSNPSDAEDVTAEVYVRMLGALPRFRWQDVPFIVWLFSIARNQVISHYRRSNARPTQALPEDMEIADPGEGPGWMLEQQATFAEVWDAVKKLPEAQRSVIELRFGAGLSIRETAQALAKTENNVKASQFKAVAKLQKLLGDSLA